jgi:hypothetical protein
MNEPLHENEEITEVQSRFPEKAEYVVSPDAALQAIGEALKSIDGFRAKDLQVIRDVVRPLVPEALLNVADAKILDQLSVSYKSIVNALGYVVAVSTLLGLHTRIGRINHYYRLAVLPFLDLRLREKVKKLNKEKPFAWRLQKFAYDRLLHSLGSVVDNLVNLIALGWVFCPGIGEPNKQTGFYNRFVFGAHCGFLDLGHFFNCAIISYVYGPEAAKERAESVEVAQRRVRERRWLEWVRQYSFLAPLSNFIWGYATSADTIEDRSSDWFGIRMGEKMRAHENNGKIIEFFITQWPHLVKGDVLGPEQERLPRRIYNIVKLIVQLLRHRLGSGGVFDIAKHLQKFFVDYGALDPNDEKIVAPALLQETIDFYMNKYGSTEWHKFTSRGWEVVIPQKLWEHVVRDKLTQDKTKLNSAEPPIRIQLDNGEKVTPYFREG